MGVDVFGIQPKSKVGSLFMNNWGAWRPLANYSTAVAPDITSGCRHWFFNDGEGLAHQDALALAAVLKTELSSGRALDYARDHHTPFFRMRCITCRGIGCDRLDVCPDCDGKRYIQSDELRYFFVENMEHFTEFLQDSGGFKIW